MPETSRAIASASSSVRYERLPIVEREERSGKTIIKLLPKEDICSSMLLFAPAPTAKAAMTAATPMMMPSAVSIERVLFLRRAVTDAVNTSGRAIIPASSFR